MLDIGIAFADMARIKIRCMGSIMGKVSYTVKVRALCNSCLFPDSALCDGCLLTT